MKNTPLKQALNINNGVATTNGNGSKSFPALLEQYKNEIARALPKHLNADRMTRIALTEFRKNKTLADCDPSSIFASIIMASQLGLEVGVMGQGYLVPYKGKCQFIPGWQGLYDLVIRTGKGSIETHCVYQGDFFEFVLGTESRIVHRPCGEDETSKMTHVYGIGRINGVLAPIHEIWTIDKIKRLRDRNNKVGTSHYSFQHFEMYARKVVLLQLIKYMPKSIELSQASSLEYSGQTGSQNLNIDNVIDGSWSYEDDPIHEKKEEVLVN